MPSISEDYARDHFQEVVQPAALEFLKQENLGSRRHGYQAAIMLAHMAEYAFHAGLANTTAGKASDYYKELARTNPDFELLADVCDASKHAVLRASVDKGDKKRDRAFSGSEKITSGPQLANSSRPANSDVPINQNVIQVTFDQGPQAGTYRELDLAVQKVLAYWRRELRVTP